MAAIFKFLWVIISLCFFGYCAYFAVVNASEIDLILLPTLPALTVPIWLAMLWPLVQACSLLAQPPRAPCGAIHHSLLAQAARNKR